LRAELDRLDGWIVVLDTKGINVWCAAGKGTFSTDEIIRRTAATRLDQVVSHRKVILPQLGAPGVKAHEVKKRCGFTVRYGPIRAQDIPTYLDNHLKATPEMRLVQFPLSHRLALVPVDLLSWGKWALIITAALALLSGFGADVYSVERVFYYGIRAAIPILGGALSGAVLTPVLLPWLPGRVFAVKGAFAGVLFLLGLAVVWAFTPFLIPNWADLAAGVLLIVAAASFVGMNFTGSSTYTSLSGVQKEMKTAVPLQAAAAALGLGFWIAARWV
jgi:acetyl-CoA decarbonylase/synthase complex subunit gamma